MNSQAKDVIPANTANPSGEISIRVKDQVIHSSLNSYLE